MRIELNGRIDSNNAPQIEKMVLEQLEGQDGASVEIDAGGLEYISSAGLRVLLRVRKSHPDMTITGVSSEVYEILDMTGFTEMMTVEKGRTAWCPWRAARRSAGAPMARSTVS